MRRCVFIKLNRGTDVPAQRHPHLLLLGLEETVSTEPSVVVAEAAGNRSMIDVRSPSDGQVIGSVADMSAAEVDAVAARLRRAQPDWAEMGFAKRRMWLERFRDWILDNEDRLLRLVQRETGKTWGDLPIGEIVASVDVLNYWARSAEGFLAPERAKPHSPLMMTKRMQVTFHPHQLVGSITPWNAQLAMQMLDVPAALMAGVPC